LYSYASLIKKAKFIAELGFQIYLYLCLN